MILMLRWMVSNINVCKCLHVTGQLVIYFVLITVQKDEVTLVL